MDWAEVRTMDAEGIPRRQIAKRLGIDPRTVKRLAESEEPPAYRRKPAGSVLDPLKAVIADLIKGWPEIMAPRVTEVLRDEHGARGLSFCTRDQEARRDDDGSEQRQRPDGSRDP